MKISKLLSAVLAVCLLAGCAEKETQVEVSSVSLNTSTIEMVEGETFNLIATVSPNDAVYDKVIWASSNASVASVNQGTVTALKQGTSTITASAGGKSATCTVKVSAKVIAVTSVTLDKTSLSMKIGDSETLTATVNPADATDKTITWMSSDVSVVTVSDGKLTAKDSGTATITAKAGNCTADCTVTVSVDVESVSLDITTLSLIVGESATLTATVKPDNATDKNVVWTSSDNAVATVSDGKVTAVNAGTATVKATCGGKTAECAVNVTVPTGSITLDKTVLSLAVGESATLTATVKPDNATDKNVVWTSSDNTVVTVSNGKVTAVNAGTATIKATCGGKTAECAVNVTVPTGSITLDKTTLSLAVGESATLTATVKPDNATDKNVVWTSSDNSVATVSNGRVTAVKAGTATVKATCGGKTAECVVTVKVPVSSISLNKTILTIGLGETETLSATVKPDNATDKTVKWASSDESVITVKNGEIYAKKEGIASISASVESESATCSVQVIRRDNVIYYQSTDNQVLTLYSESGFGANIISNEYSMDLGRIVFDDNVTSIGSGCFYKCSKLKSILLPTTVSVIGNKCFSGCSSLSQINIPDIVTSIGNGAFSKSAIETIKLPETLLYLGSNAFYECKKLESANIPDGITTLNEGVFCSCTHLNSIAISKNIKTIGNSAFAGCIELENVKLPSSLESIESNAFRSCKKLKEIIFPETLTEIGYSSFNECSGLKQLIIPGKVSSLPFYCFEFCSSLETVTLNEGVRTVSSDAFDSCSIKTLFLPSTLTYLDGFRRSNKLSEIYIKALVPPYIVDADSIDSALDVTVYVPMSSVEAYQEKWGTVVNGLIIKGYDY
jgi:uncharacterized protein YjdB